MPRGLTLPRRLLSLLVITSLAGCAGAGFKPPDRPQDFPLHSSDHPFFNLHWRLDRQDGAVSAAGLVEAARVGGGIAWVMVELKGIDGEGRVVGHGFGRTFAGEMYQWDTQPFVVRLRLIGQEARFDLSVWSYGWVNDGDSRD